MTTGERVPATSADINADRIDALKDLFPEAFTEGKVDLSKLQAALGDVVETAKERYSFTWAGKSDAIRLLQTPTSATLVPDKTESVNWDTTENLFIEGDNLEVLKLLYKAYFGRVKMIYIDPPYNTGNEFIYPDNYRDSLDTYRRMVGDLDTRGNLFTSNSEVGGRYHSRWLSMMYPRLFIARQLLREDGVIFVSIDDNEVHNLRALMNEVFGEENFVSTIIWEKKYAPQNDARWLSDNHDYVLLYARNKEVWRPNLLPRTEESDARYQNPDNDPRGPWKPADLSVRTYTSSTDYPITTPNGRVVRPPEGRCWVVSQARFKELVQDKRIWFGREGNNVPALKKFLTEVKQGMTSLTIWTREEVGDTQAGRQTIRDIFGDTRVFDTPKSVALICKMLQLATSAELDEIVLDFFAGSSTTAHAVLEQNVADGGTRRFIMVQLPEPTGLPEHPTIAEVGKERIRRVLDRLARANQGHFGFKVFKLDQSAFRAWSGTSSHEAGNYQAEMALFVDTLHRGWNPDKIIYELAIKKGFPLNCRVLKFKALGGNEVYSVVNQRDGASFYVCLDDALDPQIAVQLKLRPTDTLICRDAALTDALAANLALTCRLETL